MKDLKQHSLAIGVIFCLLIIKLVIIPVVDWQNQKISEINLKEKRLNKSIALLLQQDQLKLNYQQLDKQLAALADSFYPYEDQNTLKRKLQQNVESKLKNLNIRVNTIGWKGTSKTDNALLTQLSLEFRGEGNPDNVLEYLLLLNRVKPVTSIKELNLILSSNKTGKLGRIRIHAQLSYFMLNNSESSNKSEGDGNY